MTTQPLRRASRELLDACFSFDDFHNPTREPFRHGKTTYTLVQSLKAQRLVGYDIEPATVQYLSASLLDPKGHQAAYFAAAAYRPKGSSGWHFIQSCDADCQEAYDMAEILNACFEMDKLSKRAIILSLERIAIHPAHAGKGLMAALMTYLLDRLSKRPAITILKAYPLEFEGQPDADKAEFSQLQAGLIDYYARTLDMEPLPGSHGEEGWLYSARVPHKANTGDDLVDATDLPAPPVPADPAN